MQIDIVLYPGLATLGAIGPYELLRLRPDAEVRFVGGPGPVDADRGGLIATAAGVDNTGTSAAGSRSTPLAAGGGIGGLVTPRSQP